MAVKQPKGKIVRRLGTNIFGNPKYSKLLSKKPNAPGKERGVKQPFTGNNCGKNKNSALPTVCPKNSLEICLPAHSG